MRARYSLTEGEKFPVSVEITMPIGDWRQISSELASADRAGETGERTRQLQMTLSKVISQFDARTSGRWSAGPYEVPMKDGPIGDSQP